MPETVIVENREQFKRYCQREVCNNMLLLPPEFDEIFVDLLLKAFDAGMMIGQGKSISFESTD